MTREARGTAATPLLVSIRVSIIVIWVLNGKLTPAAWATKMDASAR